MTGNPRIDRLVEVLRERAHPPGTPVEIVRADTERAVAVMPVAEGVSFAPTEIGGRPGEVVTPAEQRRDDVVVWFHGGGYAFGSPSTVRPMVSILARELGCRIVTPDYRLAPEHRFPAAVDDAVAAYDDLLRAGHRPETLAFAGDSAGGGLVLAALVAARDQGLPMPAAGVCVSPWADMATSASAPDDPQVTPEHLAELASWYLGDTDPATPLASPVNADLTGLPPLLVQVGGAEALLVDADRVAERARGAGVDVTYECWDHMIHVWHGFAPKLEEGTAALRRIAEWLGERFGAAH